MNLSYLCFGDQGFGAVGSLLLGFPSEFLQSSGFFGVLGGGTDAKNFYFTEKKKME